MSESIVGRGRFTSEFAGLPPVSVQLFMDPIRIGCVSYLNTVPLIEGLERCEGLELVRAAPAMLAGMLERGEVDLALASLIDAARSSVPLAVLPVGMIGCDGPTMTVRLFSRVPFERVTRVHADTESHTSVVLCRVVLEKMFGVRPEVVDFDAREGVEVGGGRGASPETLLLIGDKVVTCAPERGEYPHELDLGEAWKKLIGLPFVYAAWMCRAADAGKERIRLAAALLDRARRRNTGRLDWIVEQRAPEHRWPVELARSYLRGHLRYELGERERMAAERFLSDAAGMGLIKRTKIMWGEMSVAGAVSAMHEVTS